MPPSGRAQQLARLRAQVAEALERAMVGCYEAQAVSPSGPEMVMWNEMAARLRSDLDRVLAL